MADDDAAERASYEIKALIRRLDPKDSSHNDRIRRLKKFRNFVTGEGKEEPPEFYDDDIPLLLLGSAAPPALLGDDPEVLNGNMYGLLQACGTPSVEHDHMLKRSARYAMNLLKFLVCDYVEDAGVKLGSGGPERQQDLNLFSQCFCALPVDKYKYLSLDLHVVGDQRGGAKEDACFVMVQLLCFHMAEDGETSSPMAISDLLLTPQAQQAFEVWCTRRTSKELQSLMKENGVKREEFLRKLREAELENPGLDGGDGGLDDGADYDNDDLDLDDDGMGGRAKKEDNQVSEMEKQRKGPAIRWEDSQVYRDQRARMAAHQRMQEGGEFHDTVRDSQEAAAEMAEREEEKSKIMRKDPLGLKDGKFDLRTIERTQVEVLEQALLEFQEELRKGEAGGEDAIALRAKKESLESILDGIIGVAGAEAGLRDTGRSILPTEPNFDPILFLTLVHRNATYEELVGSMNRLSTDTQNQVKQLQDMVRENFALFLRCADGIDVFNEKTLAQSGPSVVDRLNRLDALAESCTHQAKKSFKPLLDNANEVRKVQSALAVLQRVETMLQAPYLMRQHVENGRFSAALKAYRRVLVIDEHCNIELLNHVKGQAAECAREARRELEGRLAQEKISVTGLLDAIRDLGELLELDIPHDPKEAEKVAGSRYRAASIKAVGTFTIGTISINVRDHPPALSCLLLQAAHFSYLVNTAIDEADVTTHNIFDGESLASQTKGDNGNGQSDKPETPKKPASSNQWKYDILEARSIATIKAVEIVSTWLPRLLHVAKAAKEEGKRRAARVVKKRGENSDNHMSPFEVIMLNIAPAVTRVVEHAAFCGLGSAPRGSGMDIKMTFGKKSPEKLRALLRSPLPPSQSSRVGKELADMVQVLSASSVSVNELKPEGEGATFTKIMPLQDCQTLGEQSVMTIERRRCIYAFDICARGCSSRATGSGKFDADALLTCLKTLSDELSRPDQCASEVEKGCELVIRKCCDGLASYVRDRGDAARLSAVAECADVLLERMTDVAREIGVLTNNADAVEEVMMEDIMGLEGAMFDEFLESIRSSVGSCCRMGWLDSKTDDVSSMGFPPYLSASLLAIVRTRAQVEQALGTKLRRSEGTSYQHIALTTVAEAVAEGICEQVLQRKLTLKVRQADRLANEMQFLLNTLRRYLRKEAFTLVDNTRRMLCSKAGRGNGVQGDGPEGLAALEDLERLGRVYVLCLGE
eukprot:Nitzschia sp. Nitz4//scaffold44_size153857//100498//104314//NITZ4_002734-RA/size153857-augustus-gene-0.22-mRNA-1//-1//CDS//3329552196//3162//frame0